MSGDITFNTVKDIYKKRFLEMGWDWSNDTDQEFILTSPHNIKRKYIHMADFSKEMKEIFPEVELIYKVKDQLFYEYIYTISRKNGILARTFIQVFKKGVIVDPHPASTFIDEDWKSLDHTVLDLLEKTLEEKIQKLN